MARPKEREITWCCIECLRKGVISFSENISIKEMIDWTNREHSILSSGCESKITRIEIKREGE